MSLLESKADISSFEYEYGDIPVFSENDLSVEEFTRDYMKENKPCLIRDIISQWDAWKSWRRVVDEDSGNVQIHKAALCQAFGLENNVPVVISADSTYGSVGRDMPVQEFMQRGMKFSIDGKTRTHIANESDELLYLKDYHYALECRNQQKPCLYECPQYFCDDWLNAWWDHGRDESGYTGSEETPRPPSDFRFLYLGAKGTSTALHHDIFKSFSWSGNVCGSKQWLLFHPSQEHLLLDAHGREIAPDGRWDALSPEDQVRFSGVQHAKCVVVHQHAGELIFVPSGWYHQVLNVTDCLSINHNWFNSWNKTWVDKFIEEQWNATTRELADLKDGMSELEFQAQCERIMELNIGMSQKEYKALCQWNESRVTSCRG